MQVSITLPDINKIENYLSHTDSPINETEMQTHEISYKNVNSSL